MHSTGGECLGLHLAGKETGHYREGEVNMTLTTLDPPAPPKPKRVCFFEKGSGAKYSSSLSFSPPMLYNPRKVPAQDLPSLRPTAKPQQQIQQSQPVQQILHAEIKPVRDDPPVGGRLEG